MKQRKLISGEKKNNTVSVSYGTTASDLIHVLSGIPEGRCGRSQQKYFKKIIVKISKFDVI